MNSMVLTGERVYLKNLLEVATPELFQSQLKDLEQTKYMYVIPHPYTLEDGKNFVEYLKSIRDNQKEYELGIFLKENDQFLGAMSLHDINLEFQTASIGYWVAKEHWRKGIATEAARVLLRFGFEELGLNRIYAELQKENVASLTLLVRLGFQIEGLQRQHVKNKGILVDRYICGLLREDYYRKAR